jgi:adenosylmethionine-8-amino-7-oxononanoate aminotransferase
LGDVIILMPPLIATESELDMLATVVAESINAETMVLVEQATEISSDA